MQRTSLRSPKATQPIALCGRNARAIWAETLMNVNNPAHMSLRRGTSPRRTHQSHFCSWAEARQQLKLFTNRPRLHKAIQEQPATAPFSLRSTLQRRSTTRSSRVTPKSPTEAGLPGRCTETQRTELLHTPDTWSRCPSTETASGHESRLAPSQGRPEMSALSTAEAEGSKPMPDALPRMGVQQTPATWSRGRDGA